MCIDNDHAVLIRIRHLLPFPSPLRSLVVRQDWGTETKRNPIVDGSKLPNIGALFVCPPRKHRSGETRGRTGRYLCLDLTDSGEHPAWPHFPVSTASDN